MRQLKPRANAEDRERAMELSNKMVVDMMTQPVFDNVEVPADVAVPGDGETALIRPSIHMGPEAPAGATDSESP
jgi:hypothetical protein